jgi:hypothetical protein
MQTISSPRQIAINLIEQNVSLIKNKSPIKLSENGKTDIHTQRGIFYIAQYILHFDNKARTKNESNSLRSKSIVALDKWTELSKLCQLIGKAALPISWSDTQKSAFFLKEGVCAGTVLGYFSNFFKELDNPPPFPSLPPHLHSSPFPLGTELQSIQTNVQFYPFQLNEQVTEESSHLRFLHATFKIGARFKGNTTEITSAKILKQIGLKLNRRIPLEEKISFKIEELIPQLNQLTSPHNGYLLAIINDTGESNHALALYLQAPFHFVDSNYGIAVAQSLDTLLLFLANFLLEKYPNHHKFVLLEFTSLSQDSTPLRGP